MQQSQTLDELHTLAGQSGYESIYDANFAAKLDENDVLRSFRDEFTIPDAPEGKRTIYLCSHGLGLQPKRMKAEVVKQIDKWGREGIDAHMIGEDRWLDADQRLSEYMSKLVGAQPEEVIMMNTLTCNLHLMLMAFYQPEGKRYKILMEKRAFPSDYHAIISQIQWHKLNPAEVLIEVEPRQGETTINSDDIRKILEEQGESIALVLFGGVHSFTGQLMDMERITSWGRAAGCKVGFDCAHAVGNVPLSLHDWGCDFAVWCSYKYMNCGHACLGGLFVHSRHCAVSLIDPTLPTPPGSEPVQCAPSIYEGNYLQPVPRRMAGWWGHRLQDRFEMEPYFVPEGGASGFRMSGASVVSISCVKAAMEVMEEAGIDRMRAKSLLLTTYLEALLLHELGADRVRIVSPHTPTQRGAHLSVSFLPTADTPEEDIVVTPDGVRTLKCDFLMRRMKEEGVTVDVRKATIMRVTPVPLYNSFQDVFDTVRIMKNILLSESSSK